VNVASNTLSVLGIAGSLRRGSYNRGLIRAARELAPSWIQVTPYDLGDIPLFNADVESEGEPDAVRRFKQAIADSDALLFATPEYNHCVPGVLKNAIDWASRPPRHSVLTNRPVAIMGAATGGGGTARAQAHLRDGLAFTRGLVMPVPEVLVPFAGDRFDEAGNLHDAPTRVAVGELVVALGEWVRELRDGVARAA
jgi:chromate reductase